MKSSVQPPPVSSAVPCFPSLLPDFAVGAFEHSTHVSSPISKHEAGTYVTHHSTSHVSVKSMSSSMTRINMNVML